MRQPAQAPAVAVLPSASRQAGPVWSRDAPVVVPEHVQVQVCPAGRDRRYEVTAADLARADGLGLVAEWQRKVRGAVHGG